MTVDAKVGSERRLLSVPRGRRLKASSPWMLITIDLIGICGSLALGAFVRFGGFGAASDISDVGLWLGTTLGLVAVWLVWLVMLGAYSVPMYRARQEESKLILHASLLSCGTVAFICYVAKQDLSRGFVALAFGIGTATLMLGRYSSAKFLESRHARGIGRKRLVVVGWPRSLVEVVSTLQRAPAAGFEVVGLCLPSLEVVDELSGDCDLPVLGLADDVVDASLRVGAEAILVTGQAFRSRLQLRWLIWELEGTGIELLLAPSIAEIGLPRLHMRQVSGLPIMLVRDPSSVPGRGASKRALDLTLGVIFLLMMLPVMALVALAIRAIDGGPILYRQPRVGIAGRTFECLKFRTMTDLPQSDMPTRQILNTYDDLFWKFGNDPRVTRLGRLLRRYSLDELPQLINVVCGKMSLVGPRPLQEGELPQAHYAFARRLTVKPGLTGLWQVSGRSLLTAEQRLRLDLYYVDNWSIVHDLVILARSVRAVFLTEGAM